MLQLMSPSGCDLLDRVQNIFSCRSTLHLIYKQGTNPNLKHRDVNHL